MNVNAENSDSVHLEKFNGWQTFIEKMEETRKTQVEDQEEKTTREAQESQDKGQIIIFSSTFIN